MHKRLSILSGRLYLPPVQREKHRHHKERNKVLCEQTGYEEVSLSSLSTSDYTEINKLLENLVE